jgi:superfamily II DNA or RNA helicase
MSQLSLLEKPLKAIWDSLPNEDPHDPDGLRWFQRAATDAIARGWEKFSSQLLVMATGLGKTQCFCVAARDADFGPTLILAPRIELIEQARERYERMFGGFVDMEQGDYHASPRSDVVVGSVQSFHKARLEKMSRTRYGLIVVDEAHHGVSPSYRRIYDHFQDARLLGVTATPKRTDNLAMGKVFEHVAFIFDIVQGIEQGYLVPLPKERCKRVKVTEIDLSQVGTSQGDLAVGELDEAMVRAVDPIVQKFVENAGERQGVLFWPGVRSAEYAMLKMNQIKPGSCTYIDGKTEANLRKGIVRDLRDGRFQFLSNCGIATEGADFPRWSVVGIARPTKSTSLYTQMVGRVTRVLPGVVEHLKGPTLADERRAAIAASAKPDAMILDFVGNSGRHSLRSVVDVLGGRFTDEEIAKAKKKEEAGDIDPLAELKDARRELESIARAVRVQAKAVVSPFDPFHLFGVTIDDDIKYARFGQTPATTAQEFALRHMGVPEEQIRGLSKAAATELFKKVKGRQQHGLANYPQMALLAQFGITKKNIGFSRANEAVAYLSTTGMGTRSNYDPKRLNDILFAPREMGED